MALSIKEIEHVANLARLSLTEDEKQRFAGQLSSILNYANTLNELATGDVEPLTHILPVYNVLRADEPRPSMPKGEILSNAPLAEEGQYKVPKIM